MWTISCNISYLLEIRTQLWTTAMISVLWILSDVVIQTVSHDTCKMAIIFKWLSHSTGKLSLNYIFWIGSHSTDTCYVLSFSLILLNTSLHNPSVKDKVSGINFLWNSSSFLLPFWDWQIIVTIVKSYNKDSCWLTQVCIFICSLQ